MNINKLAGSEVEVSEHNSLMKDSSDYTEYEKTIIFGVPLDITDQDVLDETGAALVRRLMKKDYVTGESLKTESVVLSFLTLPPKEIYIGFRRYNAKIFIPQPLRCLKCQKYGHTKSVCHGKTTCPRCAGGHAYEDCGVGKDSGMDASKVEGIKCSNCGLQHSSAFKGCEVYKKNQEIMKVKTLNRMSYAEAASMLSSRKQNEDIDQTITQENGNVHLSRPQERPAVNEVHTVSSASGTTTHYNSNSVPSPSYRLSNPPSTTSTPARQLPTLPIHSVILPNSIP